MLISPISLARERRIEKTTYKFVCVCIYINHPRRGEKAPPFAALYLSEVPLIWGVLYNVLLWWDQPALYGTYLQLPVDV